MVDDAIRQRVLLEKQRAQKERVCAYGIERSVVLRGGDRSRVFRQCDVVMGRSHAHGALALTSCGAPEGEAGFNPDQALATGTWVGREDRVPGSGMLA